MSTKIEILENKDGSKTEKLTQQVCRACRRIEGKCKCGAAARIETVVTKRPYIDLAQSLAEAKGKSALSEEESQKKYEEKLAKRAAKKNRQDAVKRIASMDDDEFEAQDKKSEEQRKLDAEIAERSLIAAENVDKQRKLKAHMKAEGNSKADIKKAVKALKADQKDSLEKSEPEEEKKGKKKRGRPARHQLHGPKKDPQTGKFYSSEKK